MALTVPFPTDGLVNTYVGVGDLRALLIPGSFDYDIFEDNFWGDALNAIYPAAKTNGTSAAVTFTEHNANGFLELVSGTDDDGYAGQGLGLQLTGDRGLLAEFIITLPAAITTMKFEVGVSDADDDAGAVNVKTTPSHTATDYGVFIFDTDENTNLDFMTDGASLAAQETTNVFTVAANDVLRLAIRVNGNNIEGWVNGTKVASHAAAIEGGNKLTPWAFAQARAGSASRTVQLNKLRVTQPAY